MYYCDVERDCPQADGDEPAGDWVTSLDSVHNVLVNKKSNAMLMFILFFTEENRVLSLLLFRSQSPRIFHLYLSVSCAFSWSFPAALTVLVFQVPMVMLSFPRIFDDAPVACLTPPSWCTVEGAVPVDPSGDRSGMVWLLVFIIW